MNRIPPALAAWFWFATTASAAEIVIESPMDRDPGVELPGTIASLPPGHKTLWVEALSGPESELRMRAAEAIARAGLLGLDDMRDATPGLVAVLTEADQGLPVRLAAARALVAIDARGAAPELLAQVERDGLEMGQVVEPAFAAGTVEPARTVWLRRLDAEDAPHQQRVLAARCLGIVRDSAASAGLQRIVASESADEGLRLEAGRALGEIDAGGLEALATTLASEAQGSEIVARMAAASMLKQHRSDKALSLLKSLALDSEPAVAAVALRWLLDVDPVHVAELSDRVLTSRDAVVRRLACRGLVEAPSVPAVTTLGPMLDDVHPEVRGYVRDSLFSLAARPEFADPVRTAGMQALAGDGWRGPEQAAMLLGALDHEPSANRLLELLEHPRPEVAIASAWALRRLALPETLAPMFAFTERRTRELQAGRPLASDDAQLAQLFQAFGEMTFQPADALLRLYVPKLPIFPPEARAAAVWTLGHLHAGRPDAELVPQLESRLKDTVGMPPEYERVRRMAAATLGRMRADDALDTLRAFDEETGALTLVSGAVNWAVTQLTGEPYPSAPEQHKAVSNWFLEPL